MHSTPAAITINCIIVYMNNFLYVAKCPIINGDIPHAKSINLSVVENFKNNVRKHNIEYIVINIALIVTLFSLTNLLLCL